ncbi:GNAT family N-acetyltransferase [Pseudolysinimonas sp.]|uniref:GNAT family N-acetyltransferase n=1 Tax=Pseudolysinimonas sp. TaxID=2680009 RepID=UPI00286C00ED|nr:GNAT family N-acetyltransferase [Pseudolysinimonas sp.]
MPVDIRPYTPADLTAVVAINDAAYPAVPITPAEELVELIALSRLTLVVDDGEPAGFIVALAPGLDYASENYTWFSARSSDFLYVDRIVLAPRLQGQGVGPRLYAAVDDAARADGATEITCEVNVRPPNPGSLAFHARLGFIEVGRQQTKGGANEVALFARAVASNGGAISAG